MCEIDKNKCKLTVSKELQKSAEFNDLGDPKIYSSIAFINKVSGITSLKMINYDVIDSTYFIHSYRWVGLVAVLQVPYRYLILYHQSMGSGS